MSFSNGATLVKHNYKKAYEYGIYSTGCQVTIGLVIDDKYEITSFSSNIIDYNPKKVYYEGTQKEFNLMFSIPYGTYNQIPFTATNSNGQTSNLAIQFDQEDFPNQIFECKKFDLSSPALDIVYISDFYLNEQSMSYGFYFKFADTSITNVGYGLKCTVPFAKQCSFGVYPEYIFIVGTPLDPTKMAQKIYDVTITDLNGVSKTIQVKNTLFNTSPKQSVIKSISVNPPNGSEILRETSQSLKVTLQVIYSELNTTQLLKSESTQSFTEGSLVLGTPEEQTMIFTFNIGNGAKENYSYLDIASQVTVPFTLNFTTKNPPSSHSPISPVFTIEQSTETGNLVFKTQFQTPYLSNNIYASPLYFIGPFTNSTSPIYPYGISKSNSNSYWSFNSNSLFVNSNYGGQYSVGMDSYGSYGGVGLGNSISIPNFPGLIKSDPEGPFLRHYSVQQLENNKLLITFNITDIGSGLLNIFGLIPNVAIFAKQAIVSGDINNGIYQILATSSDVLNNELVMMNTDYMGNFNLYNSQLVFSDMDFGGITVLENLRTSNITYFKFDRLHIDTSFDDLDLTLSINFDGASETSVIPRVTVVYLDMRKGYTDYLGTWNKTTQMFDVKLKAQARDRGTFKYYLFIAPLTVYPYDIEIYFPDQVVKLTSNYVDHYPPTITSLKATDYQLTVAQGNSVELGWDIEIYDYPVGLDYGVIEVSSNLDYEPRVFNIKPNTTIFGSDINPTYSIRFNVEAYVDQVFFISKCIFYDKNGYFSQYPPQLNSGFDAFYNSKFTLERNIQVNISSPSQQKDVTAPQLLSFSYPQSFDSFGINRVATFEFSIKDEDLGSGISLRHNPYVYVQFLYQNHVRVQSVKVSQDNNTGIYNYRAEINFDYGALAYGAIVSIHGIVDNSLNMASYSSQDLKVLGFGRPMVNSASSKPPVILENTDLKEDGGKLFIYGRAFTDSPVVYMDKGSRFEVITPTFQSNLALTLNVPSVKGISLVKFKVRSGSQESNIISVIPIVNPVSQASNCSSLSDCSGKGTCVSSKCVCDQGFSGPDCSSTSLPLNKPNSDTPSFSSFGSMILLNELI
ncbi:hypothetical protein DICPUDRAFT_76554 [Dictyostelium purpureum]|uniref:EGF-like domain-containing protein n=1 Tax=Dictyostelium purpureum TaxID=5786 RepID=F0ZDY8_DICPU|nr:uncharacterized protein DICPUDRAFT_76554 [Dictyostelium purpureum]EGC37882.1 hypothetical protein DICPUDRAFT_76554 [Dictyostelium purpureum]|eukprot:XP_003285632.1 hypothetical protein DICPUDRAFT_76554 [Dictyostelium purpureum]